MKILELKHLAPYLPYGLMFKDLNIYNYLIPENMKHVISLQQKPILQPLSDLTKKVQTTSLYVANYSDNINYYENTPLALPYIVVDWLLSEHYDIFNLIERGLAIDVNTLEVNPYE